jgi:hypothetical protein
MKTRLDKQLSNDSTDICQIIWQTINKRVSHMIMKWICRKWTNWLIHNWYANWHATQIVKPSMHESTHNTTRIDWQFTHTNWETIHLRIDNQFKHEFTYIWQAHGQTINRRIHKQPTRLPKDLTPELQAVKSCKQWNNTIWWITQLTNHLSSRSHEFQTIPN